MAILTPGRTLQVALKMTRGTHIEKGSMFKRIAMKF